ncbi:MAG: aspartate aminotransferase family protein [Gemmatimonadetes bacterium]|nr:MAG: aspartate aminotransferase family protein [Gemmatimonadota bacterium]
MTTPSVASDAGALLGVYARVGPVFVAGEGSELIAEDGARYLDFVAGIAVNALGYNSPVFRDAVMRALDTGLVHVSNLYRTEPGERLATELAGRAFPSGGQAFFCNSGAEANEGAFKFSRKWSGKTDIVAFTGSFHGRLFASLAATDRPDYRRAFEPLLAGVQIIPLGDKDAARSVITAERTAAVIIEPVQGEGGVRPVPAAFLAFLRELCDSRKVALIFDEVQCGLGRTGTWFAAEQSGVVPDMYTLAKPLGGGLPMGAILLNDRIAAPLAPGDHATTFGGGPFVATVALDVVRAIGDHDFLADVRAKGKWLGAALAALVPRRPRVREARGRGLMWGLELNEAAAPVVAAARDRHLLVLTAGATVIRIVPPLTVSRDELERGVAILDEVLA